MDWATFFKDYGQSLFTLGGVFLGSAITFFINFINVRTQSKERDKDREEQRREAKSQLALELMRNDAKVIEDLVDDTLTSINEMITLTGTWVLNLSDDEIRKRIDKEFFRLDDESKIGGLVADKLAYTIGHEFYSEYESFQDSAGEMIDIFTDFDRESKSSSGEHINGLSKQIIHQSAKLHNMLQEKLISIRDG